MSSNESLITHPKAKEWLVSAARANYQELAKLSGEFPELAKMQVSEFYLLNLCEVIMKI